MRPREPITMAMPIVWMVSKNGYAQSDSPTQVPKSVCSNHSRKPIQPPHGTRREQATTRGILPDCSSAKVRGFPKKELPGDAVVFTEIARSAPERTLRAIDEHGVDRSRRLVPGFDVVAHALELGAHPRGRVDSHDQPTRLR